MDKRIKYLIENIINFNPADYSDTEDNVLSSQDINTLIRVYPKTKEELKELVVKRLKENPENPWLLDINTSLIMDMSGLFNDSTEDPSYRAFNEYFNKYGVSSANIKELNLGTWNTSRVIDMSNMFHRCKSLKKVNLSFDTSKVTHMNSMFSGCESIVELDLSSFDTSNVLAMEYMFCLCKSLTDLNIQSFDTSNAINMKGMFSNCKSLKKLDLSHFNADKVANMKWMFADCCSLTDLNLSNFDTAKPYDTKEMFQNCNLLTKDGLICNNSKIKYKVYR